MAQSGPPPHELLRVGVVGDGPAGGVHGHGLHEGAVVTGHDVGVAAGEVPYPDQLFQFTKASRRFKPFI